MDKQLWKKVETLFHDALLLPTEQRLEFVLKSAPDDSRLQFEVLTLIKSHETDSGFLDQNATPAWSATLEKLTSELHDQQLNGVTVDGNRQFENPKFENREFENQFESSVAAKIEVVRPDFVVKKVINRGGMGTVLRVYQRELNRDVAIKVLSVHDVDPAMRRRFIQESQATAQVKNDHVIEIYEVCSDPDLPYLVMELIDGPSLKRFIELQRQIQPRTAAELARQIADGLAAAHAQHLIHRDIKPANVLLEPIKPESIGDHPNDLIGYRAKIIDFGLARAIDHTSGESQDQLFAGTLFYMSPEQISQPRFVDHRSDVYSLGVTLYQMLTGVRPFQGAQHMVMREIQLSEPTPPRSLDDRIPKDLESICLKAMSKEPERRYQTAADFSEDLIRFLNGFATQARPVSRREKVARWIGRNQRVALFAGLAGGMLTLLTVGSLIFAFTVKSKDRTITQQDRQITSKDRVINQQVASVMNSQIKRVLDADAGALSFAINDLQPKTGEVLDRLEKEFHLPSNDFNRRFNAAVALSILGSNQTEFIVDNLDKLFVSPNVFANVVSAIGADENAKPRLRESLDPAGDPVVAAKRIILLAYLGDFEPWEEAASDHENMTCCTEVIHTFPNWHGDLILFSRSVEATNKPAVNWTFCQAISLLDRRSLNQESFETLANLFRGQANLTNEFIVYCSARDLLASWDKPFPERLTGFRNAWYELANGIRMVKVQPATSTMGRLEQIKMDNGYPPHEVTLSRPFYLGDTEISVRQYLEFLEDPNCSESDKPEQREDWEYSTVVSPTEDHPIQNVSWNDAALFCNWLSRRERLQPVYQRAADATIEIDDDEVLKYQGWVSDKNANGYRLPHEHEFELACRAGSKTPYFFGTRREYFSHYGLASNHTRLPAGSVRSRLPNRLGFYDVHGNLWEWCDDWFSYLDESPLTDPQGPGEPIAAAFGRVIRSGGVGTMSGETDSESRGWQRPGVRYDNLGFRVARNAD